MVRKQVLQVVVVVVLVAMVLVGGTASSAPAKSAITLNPLGFILGVYNANYEIVNGNNSSIVVSAAFMNYEIDDDSLTSIGGGVAYRYYVRGDAPNGFYVGPSVSLASVTVKEKTTNFWTGVTETESATAVGFGLGANAGHQWVLDSGLVFDFQLGLLLSLVSAGDINAGGVTPTLGFGIGYAW